MIHLLRLTKRFLIELTISLLLELLLNANELEPLADFGEFVFSQEIHVQIQEVT